MARTISPAAAVAAPLPFTEFVILMASLMAINALAIDSMLPALPDVAAALGIKEPNNRQLVISAYLLGAGLGAPVHGPLADRFGRKPVLLLGLAGYVVFALASSWMPSLPLLLAARVGQGFFAASAFVLAVTIIRDRYVGDEMARLMSLASITFMIVPVLAPLLGQLLLTVSDWRSIFYLLATLGGCLWLWVALRLPETLKKDDVLPASPHQILANWWRMARHRQAMAYTLSSGIFFGALFGFINSAQQIFSTLFDAADTFPVAFAAIAGSMAVSNFINSRFVRRHGARRMSHGALIVFILLALVEVTISEWTSKNMTLCVVMIALSMSMGGFVGANVGSIAMEPFGHIAGAASSFQSFVRMTFGAVIGATIGHFFDGSTLPLAIGFLLCGLTVLGLVLWAEEGVLFRRHGLHEREEFNPREP